jgi:mRNA-degrading endonuclease RelE of RelBE toxin-antitoxin system
LGLILLKGTFTPCVTQRPNPFPCVAVIALVIYKKRMIIISNEAKVKLETLAPKVAKLLLRQFEHLEAAQTRVRMEAEGKIKQLHGLANTYSLAASPNYLVIFKSQGNDLIISDIVNVAFLEYMRRTTENAKPT